MTDAKQPITIKKYANRRLYNTGTSSYVTLEDLAKMVKIGEDFVVYDAKSGDDITRSVLTQIIFEQEGKDGQNLLPITFLRQLIRFYGDSMQMLVPSYLEFSIDKLVGEQQKMRDQLTNAFGAPVLPGHQMFTAMEEQARKNMAMFTQAMSMFGGFNPAAKPEAAPGQASAPKETMPAEPAAGGDIDTLRQQIADMQKKLEAIARKD
jgi:polyhydroxyalkanoate synthesis repressor PhaR